MDIEIKKITNGYLIEDTFYPDLQKLFEELLSVFEGKSKYFGGDYFGQVFVAHKPKQEFIANDEL